MIGIQANYYFVFEDRASGLMKLYINGAIISEFVLENSHPV